MLIFISHWHIIHGLLLVVVGALEIKTKSIGNHLGCDWSVCV